MPNPIATYSIASEKPSLIARSALFLTATEKIMGVSPEVSFKTMTEVYFGDLATRASVDFLSDQIAGMGFYTTMNEECTEKSKGKTAKEIVDEFCDQVGLDEALQASAKHLAGWGNVFWWNGASIQINFLKTVLLEIIKDKGIKLGSKSEIKKIQFNWKREPRWLRPADAGGSPINIEVVVHRTRGTDYYF